MNIHSCQISMDPQNRVELIDSNCLSFCISYTIKLEYFIFSITKICVLLSGMSMKKCQFLPSGTLRWSRESYSRSPSGPQHEPPPLRKNSEKELMEI